MGLGLLIAKSRRKGEEGLGLMARSGARATDNKVPGKGEEGLGLVARGGARVLS